MAITQNMTFFPHQDIIEVEPLYFRKLKKTVPDGNNGWEERIFYAITKDVTSARQWLDFHYSFPLFIIHTMHSVCKSFRTLQLC